MTNESKIKIKSLLQEYVAGFESQAKAANSLKDVSGAIVSQILNDKTELISDKMWLNVGKQVGFKSISWKNVPTYNYRVLTALLKDAKEKSRVHAIIGGAGWGKDTAAKDFASTERNVYLINCNEFFNKKYFMMELLIKMGEMSYGSVPDMVSRAVKHINRTDTPIIILNEADKLKDEILLFFITFYNLCEDKCSIVLMSTNQLEVRLTRGMAANKKGYQEIFSRIGRRFIELKKPSKSDITAICTANGVDNPEDIMEIYNGCEGDCRRVKKLILNKADKADQAA
jgi:Cdc6-like AAA superfamily ATPase